MVHGGIGFDHTELKGNREKMKLQTRKGETDIMKTYKKMFVAAILGGVMMILPKATWAGDISVGFFMGLPVPVVTFDAPRVHHIPPPVVIAPAPVYPRWQAYGQNYNSNKHYRHDNNGRFGHRNYGYWDQDRGHGRDRYDRDGRWDRR